MENFRVVLMMDSHSGSAGVTVAAQLRRSQAASEHLGKDGDIAILDPAERHHYQREWKSTVDY